MDYSIFQCPYCGAELETHVQIGDSNGYIYHGGLYCGLCRSYSGSIERGQINFSKQKEFFPFKEALFEKKLYNHIMPAYTFCTGEKEFVCTGQMACASSLLLQGSNKECCKFTVYALEFGAFYIAHQWGGIFDIYVDGSFYKKVDTFLPSQSNQAEWISFEACGKHEIAISSTGEKNLDSLGVNIHILGYSWVNDRENNVSFPIKGRTNDFSLPAKNILELLAEHELGLDLGSGDRTALSNNIINFEYAPLQCANVIGNAHKLPFKSNTFDLILSQAVLEHVEDPIQVGREIQRILKPGGVVYVEVAFLHPLHAVPFHYFNHTFWGVEKVFEKLNKVFTKSEGSLESTISWYLQLAGAGEYVGNEAVEQILKQIKIVDEKMTADQFQKVSSYVTHCACKPGNVSEMHLKCKKMF